MDQLTSEQWKEVLVVINVQFSHIQVLITLKLLMAKLHVGLSQKSEKRIILNRRTEGE
ncbi:hypothetical protein Caka_0874 [Coraliomargarita akajimensis DSM 45221]|uniref:Uncharacterized protein n=1 Tax=Coraliomargarita akajimensis (strain DSM 45221 / IAM 15411 / JCM 23193 / KCTC 12865 / 04OKA010-24) TaxID=583355 RepID=D5EQC9_CORAD|nr:hypothetical protein Caka_0874 [Coraliomargarita akajimensis DSM 45221]